MVRVCVYSGVLLCGGPGLDVGHPLANFLRFGKIFEKVFGGLCVQGPGVGVIVKY